MSCLFNSLSRLIGEPPQQIRLKICDYLENNPALYEDLSASLAIHIEKQLELPAYIQQMRSPSTWGGAIEIRSFVNLWRRPVKVWAIRQKRWIEFPCENSIGPECKLSWSGGHYEPM
ncbi:MAG: hypothetical protein EBT86_01010 [Actinobacteria bacterium]|nr:hypothetical protein [Actinomycetota bacterium]